MLEREHLLQDNRKFETHIQCFDCDKVISRENRYFKIGSTGSIKCFACAAQDSSLLRRAAIISLIVGTLLTIINQGDLIFTGQFEADFAWKIPLTYMVPFMVSWTSVMSASLVTSEDPRHRL